MKNQYRGGGGWKGGGLGQFAHLRRGGGGGGGVGLDKKEECGAFEEGGELIPQYTP